MPKIQKKHQVNWTDLIQPEIDAIEEVEDWDELAVTVPVERIRKQTRDEMPDLHTLRRQRQRDASRDYQRSKKDRHRNGDSRP